MDAFVGARIALRRAALGLSQTALAERLGISFQQVQKYESGTNRISASRLHRVAVILGAPPATFFPSFRMTDDQADAADTWMTGLIFLAGTAEGRDVLEAFPRIADDTLRRALAQVVRALAAP
ncbi:helix-turn-helix domain-containing protein [Rhizobium sp. CRIBSB]|nr:helix-turn-helix domain-containing protein [Rhizobium sp. CRIBSB]